MGIVMFFFLVRAAAASESGTATLIISHPAEASLRICSIVAWYPGISVGHGLHYYRIIAANSNTSNSYFLLVCASL